jgi:biopolymer transport protein ExbD
MAITTRKDDDVMAEINITPFTDVLLVLLIIFMLLATLVTPPGFERSLPNRGAASVTAPQLKLKTIEITVNDVGVIRIDDQLTTTKEIYSDLARVAAIRGRLHVSIVADQKAPYAAIIRVLDAAKLAHLDDVGFVAS